MVVGEDGSGMGNGDGEGLLSIQPGARTSAAVGRKIGGDKFGERARERRREFVSRLQVLFLTLTFPTGFLFLHLFASLLVLVLEVR